MRYVGIDIAAEEHYFAIVDQTGKVLRRPSRFGENAAGYDVFFAAVGAPDETLVCMEATGHYWKNIAAHLVERGFALSLVNPLRTSRFAGEDLRRTKTDSLDAVMIAKFAQQKQLLPTKLPDAATDELRELVRYRDRIVQEIGDKTRLLNRQVDLTFPEFTSEIADLSTLTALEVLKLWPTAKDLAKVSTHVVAGLVYDGRHKIGTEKAQALIAKAKASVAQFSTHPYKLQTRRLCEDLLRLKAHLKELDTEISNSVDKHDVGKLLLSIEGIADTTASRLIAELGEISEFASPKQLAAYVGVIPNIRQSGKAKQASAGLTNVGNLELRCALWMPVQTAVRKNPWLNAFFEGLKSRGKPAKVALCAAMRKFLIAVWWVAKHRKPFDSRLSLVTE